MAWLRKRGYVDDSPLEARSNEAPAQTALDACAAVAMGRGNVAPLPRDSAQDDEHGVAEERPVSDACRCAALSSSGESQASGTEGGRRAPSDHGVAWPSGRGKTIG